MYKINLLNDMSTAYHNYLFDLRPLMIKNFSFLLRNRQFVFAPKIEYQLVAESLLRRDKLHEANQNRLQFPTWCPREESNLYHKLRKLAFYPLNYGDIKNFQAVPGYGVRSASRGTLNTR